MISDVVARGAHDLARRPRATLVVLGIMTALAALGATRLELEPGVAGLLPPEEAARFTGVESDADARSLWVLLRGEALHEQLPTLVERLRSSPLIEAVDASRDELFGRALERGREAPLWFLAEPQLDALDERLAPVGRRAAIAESKRVLAEDPIAGRELVLRDPLGLRLLLDAGEPAAQLQASLERLDPGPWVSFEAGTRALLRVRAAHSPYEVERSVELCDWIERELRAAAPLLYGGPAVARADASRIKADMKGSLGWSIPLVVVFLAFSLASLFAAHLVLVPVALALLWTLGLAPLLIGPLPSLAVGAVAILIGLAVDFPIHAWEQLRLSAREADAPARAREAARHLARPLLGAALTSGLAFLSLASASAPAVRSFALLCALGLGFALLATALLAPVCARSSLATRERTARPAPRLSASASRALCGLLLVGGALGWGVAFARGVDWDLDPEHLRPADGPLMTSQRALHDELWFCPTPVRVSLAGADAGTRLRAGVNTLLAEAPMTVAFAGGEDLTRPDLQRSERVDAFRTRHAGWVAGALADLRAEGFQPEPFRAGLEQLAHELDGDPTLAPLGAESALSIELWSELDLRDPQQRGQLHDELAQRIGADVIVDDPHALSERLEPLFARDLGRALLLSSLAVALCAWLTLGRRLRDTLLALVPAACALGGVLGLSTLLGWPLSPGSFLALPLVAGLAVDDGLHLACALRAGDATRLAGAQRGVWRTSMTSAIGFGSLCAAQSPALRSLGALVLVGLALAFATSVVALPVLWRRSS